MATVALVVIVVAGFATSVTGRANSRCVSFRINGTFCRDLPYNTTSFPNIMGTHDLTSALSEVKFFQPLTILQCSDIIEGFICSVYFPECDLDSGMIPPCRETCEAARSGCEIVLNDFAFQWPPKLNCNLFPLRADASCTFFGSTEQPNLIDLSETATATTQSNPKVSIDKATAVSPDNNSELVTTVGAAKTLVQSTKPKKNVSTTTTESIQVRLPDECKRLPYKDSFFPNVLGHWSFEEAVGNYNTFRSMLSSACSEKLSKYLCFLHFSAYDESRNRALTPCYEFCLQVRTQCLFQLPVPWPGSFSCETLPTKITPDSQCWAEDSSISTAPSTVEVFTVMQGLFQFVKSIAGFATGL